MLKTRVITAVLLLLVFLPSLFFLPQSAWALLMAAFIGVAAWEWGGLLRWSKRARVFLGSGTATFCACLPLIAPQVLGIDGFQPAASWVWLAYIVSVVFWCVVIPFWLRAKWPLSGGGGVLVGVVVLLPTWLAVVQLRALSPLALLAVMAVAWVADIAAYFSGRAFGRRKLAPSISPGKTWEGAAGAVLGVMAYGTLLRHYTGLELPAAGLWLVLLLLVTAISIVGDLYESLLKRAAGIKDSSQILPGHGGVLDRIDSLTSTLPLAALLCLLFLRTYP